MIKRFWRYDAVANKVRLFSLVWQRGIVGKGGYSAKLTFTLQPVLFRFQRDFHEWRVIVLGIGIHKRVSYGGIFPR